MRAPSATGAVGPAANQEVEQVETVVIGAGQAGLSVSHHLAKRDLPHVVLEADRRVGDSWRKRFDSLRLFTPARYDGLPGRRFPGEQWSFPTKDELADYLEAYAAEFDLPVRTGVAVESLSRDGDGYLIEAAGTRLRAAQVVVASGTFQEPIVPDFAGELDPRIDQLHSSAYRNPSQIRPGPVLVVGASHSGGDLSYELASDHEVVLSGPVRGEIPFRIDGRPARVFIRVLWFMANRVLTVRTPIGRKMRPEVRSSGGPLLRVKRADLKAAGVDHTEAKVASVENGLPVLEDGRMVEPSTVIWCTGFGKDVSWIQFPVTGEDGWPEQDRGLASAAPGLYFVGLPFLHAFASMLVGGVGRDAERIAEQIRRSAGA